MVDLVPMCSQVGLWAAAAREGRISDADAAGVLDGWAEHRVRGARGIETGAAALLAAIDASAPVDESDPGTWRSGGEGLTTILTSPGDAGPLSGPAPSTAAILAAGQAVVHNGLAWVPTAFGADDAEPYYIWRSVPVRRPREMPQTQARQELLAALQSAEASLASLGLGDRVAQEGHPVSELRDLCDRIPLPPGLTERTVGLLEQATVVLGALSLAETAGPEPTHVHEARAYEASLRPLAHAARQAVAVASSSHGTAAAGGGAGLP